MPARAERLGGKPGHRPDLEARADHEQEPGLPGELEGTVDRLGRQQLVEEDDARFQDGAAGLAARRSLAGFDELEDARQPVGGAAARAARRPDRAVHLDHVAASGALVQPVDVLRHDGLEEPEPLELGERRVNAVRLGLGRASRTAAHRSARPSRGRAETPRASRTRAGRTRPRSRSGSESPGSRSRCSRPRP